MEHYSVGYDEAIKLSLCSKTMMDFTGWMDKVIEDVLRTYIQLVFSPGNMYIAVVSIRVFRIITNIVLATSIIS